MPFVDVKLVERVFPEDQKHAMATAVSDIMVCHEDSRRHAVDWGVVGRPRSPALGVC